MTEAAGDPPASSDAVASAWTRAVRSIADINDIDAWPSTVDYALVALAAHFESTAVLPRPLMRSPDWTSERVITALAVSAHRSMAVSGYAYNGKRNAPVTERAAALVRKIDIPSYVGQETGIPFTPDLSLLYVVYDEPGAGLGLHLDSRGYSDVNLLLCLEKVTPYPEMESSTVFITSSGRETHELDPGQCLIFEGPSTLHGRTPIRKGERIILLNVGLTRSRDAHAGFADDDAIDWPAIGICGC